MRITLYITDTKHSEFPFLPLNKNECRLNIGKYGVEYKRRYIGSVIVLKRIKKLGF